MSNLEEEELNLQPRVLNRFGTSKGAKKNKRKRHILVVKSRCQKLRRTVFISKMCILEEFVLHDYAMVLFLAS